MNRKTLASEQGMALTLVLIISICIVMLAFAFVYMFQMRTRLNSLFVNRNSAGYYAEAGIDQYIWNQNQDDHYYATHHTVASAFEAGYYYVKETDPTVDDPTVTVISTGWLAKDPANKETIMVKIKKRQFSQYVYCTDTEKAPDDSQVWWNTGDEMHSSMHTNGALSFHDHPRFDDTVTFSGVQNYADNYFYSGTRLTDPQFYKDGVQSTWQTQCYHSDKMLFPSSNSDLLTMAQGNGYYFPHRTSIYLHDSAETPPHTLMNVYCWDGSQYQYKPNLPLPANGVIYVDGSGDWASVGTTYRYNTVPDSTSYNNLMTAIQSRTHNVPLELDYFNRDRGNVFISGKLRGRLTVSAANHIFICGEDPTSAYSSSSLPSQPGLIYGSTTFNTAGSVNNLGTDDMLGLVANGYIYILHNFWPSYPGFTPTSGNYGVTDCDITQSNIGPQDIYIQCGLFALNWAFQNEDYWMDSQKGNINMTGSITQKYRGIRGEFGSTPHGYNANYYHDQRMKYETPPHFLSPTNAGWGIVTWNKLPPSSDAEYKPITSIDSIYAEGNVTTVPRASISRCTPLCLRAMPPSFRVVPIPLSPMAFSGRSEIPEGPRPALTPTPAY